MNLATFGAATCLKYIRYSFLTFRGERGRKGGGREGGREGEKRNKKENVPKNWLAWCRSYSVLTYLPPSEILLYHHHRLLHMQDVLPFLQLFSDLWWGEGRREGGRTFVRTYVCVYTQFFPIFPPSSLPPSLPLSLSLSLSELRSCATVAIGRLFGTYMFNQLTDHCIVEVVDMFPLNCLC